MSGTANASEGERMLALERGLGRFRAGALVFAVVQTLIEPGDRIDVSWAVVALLALTALTVALVSWCTPPTPRWSPG
jgi:hypothetical protein